MKPETSPSRQRRAEEDPLVSVVTPFYNTGAYLEECIQSVLNQTYTHWEYILSDNCSTDGSGAIAERYAASDPRIRVYREVEFLGQVENYNRALRYISPESKYCKVVQADDWIYPRCIAEMVAVAEGGENVGVVSSFSLYDNRPGHGGLPIEIGPVYPGRDAARANLLNGTVLFGSPTCVMYRSDIVRSRTKFFSTTAGHHEDAEVCFEILRCNDFGFVPQVLTFNRRDNDSIWTRLEHYGPRLLHELLFLYRFGPYFLEADELTNRVRETETRYYRFLGQHAIRRSGKEFWAFHIDGLKEAGGMLSYRRVGLHAIYTLVDALLNPKHTFEAVLRRK